MTTQEIIDHLNLHKHPEGGWYRETFRAEAQGRSTGTCIYFLLCAGEVSHWHRVDAAEIWLYHAGAPLVLSISETDTGPATDHVLGPDLSIGAPQLVVPKDHWQSARTTGEFTLVSCAVTPGFEFEGFELAAPGFDIARA